MKGDAEDRKQQMRTNRDKSVFFFFIQQMQPIVIMGCGLLWREESMC